MRQKKVRGLGWTQRGHILCLVRHDRRDGAARARVERDGHRDDSQSAGRASRLVPVATERVTVRALGLAQRARPPQGYGGAHAVAEVGTRRPHPPASAPRPIARRATQSRRAAGAACARTDPRHVARSAAVDRERRPTGIGRPATVQRAMSASSKWAMPRTRSRPRRPVRSGGVAASRARRATCSTASVTTPMLLPVHPVHPV